MKNSIFNAVCKTRYLALLVVLIFTCGNAWGAAATLPVNYSFDDGKSSLPTGVTDPETTLGSNYAVGNSPYRLKFDNNGDYIQIEVDAAAETITIGIKEFGTSGASIQIQGSSNGSSFTNIQTLSFSQGQNKTSSQSTSNSISSSYRYFRVKRNSGSNFGLGTLQITAAESCTNPTISAHPTSATYTVGDSPTALSVTASGTSLTYQWYSNTTATNTGGTSITEQTSSTYTPSTASNGTFYYYCVVSSGSCSTNSNVATITVNKASATIKLSEAGAESSVSGTHYSGDSYTLPSSTEASCGSKVLVGWSTVTISETDTKPTSNYYDKGASVTLAAGENKFYAVFAEVSGELSNSYAAITSGLETANYVIAYSYNNGTQIVLQNTADNSSPSDKLEGYNLSLSDSKYSNPAASYIWELRAQSDGSYYIYNTAVEKYVNATSTPELTLSTTPTKFTITYDDTNSRWTIQIKESTSYYIHGYVNGTTIDFRCSTSGSGARYRIYLYKQESNISYAKYSTTCSTDPELSVTPTALDFGNVANGTYKEMTFSLSGTHLAANASIAVSGTNSSYFTVTPNSVDKGSGTISATNITVRYTPGAVGDGHTATVTVSSGEADPKTVTLTGNCKATYSVSVSPTPTNGTVTADKTSGILAGETVTLTITPNSGYVLSSITANSGAVTLDGTGNTRTFTMPAGDVTIAATFMERVDFVLVKDVNDLYEGATVVFCNKGEVEQYARVIGAYASGNNWPAVSASVFEENDQLKILTTTPNMQTLTLGDGTVDNTWSFSDGTGYIYAASSSSNYMKRETTLTANSSFTIAINSTTGEATITAQGTYTRNTMSYNTGVFFSCYASNNTQSPMYIYMIPSNCDKLPAPTGLSVSNITQNSVSLSWNSVEHASGYNVSCSGGTVEYTSGTSATVTGLTQGTAYTWSVQATGTGEYCALGLKANGNFTTKRAVTVTYRTNGASGGQLPVTGGVVNLTEGDSHEILANTGSGGSPSPLVKSGYTFDGWHNSSTYSATPAYTIGNRITVNENIVIYANWRPQQDTFFDDMHQTTGYTSGGHIESGNYTMPGPLSNVASGNACETSHYIFVGWVISSGQNTDGTINGSPKIWRAGESNNASGATYYAVWAEE